MTDEAEEAESIETDGVDASGPDEIVGDQDCFLCVALPEHVPDDSKLKVELGLTDRELHYAHGYADGVSSMIRGQGWHYCQRHLKILRGAMLDRGVNWSPEPEPTKRIIS